MWQNKTLHSTVLQNTLKRHSASRPRYSHHHRPASQHLTHCPPPSPQRRCPPLRVSGGDIPNTTGRHPGPTKLHRPVHVGREAAELYISGKYNEKNIVFNPVCSQTLVQLSEGQTLNCTKKTGWRTTAASLLLLLGF